MSALVGQTVVVIGGSAGIGLETARAARAEGAVMVTAGRPYYAPLAEIDFEQARRSFDDHLFLALRVAQHAPATLRPGGSLLFMGGTGGRRRGPGLSVIAAGTAALGRAARRTARGTA